MVELDYDQISDPTWLEGLEDIKNRKSGNFLKIPKIFLKNRKVQLRGPVGSIEGPRLVLDPMEVRSGDPRVPWNVLCCLECKNMTDTVCFQMEEDGAPNPLC